jgi:hypothetical protein
MSSSRAARLGGVSAGAREEEGEGEATGRFSAAQLGALVSRSVQASTMFRPRRSAPSIEVVTAPPKEIGAAPPSTARPPPALSREPTPSSPGFLTKSTAVLLLADIVPTAPVPQPPAPPPPVPCLPAAAPTSPPAAAPRAIPVPALVPFAAPRNHPRTREVSARVVVRRGAFRRRLLTLGLLGLVVACQPWWWNVGDLRSRPSAIAASRK